MKGQPKTARDALDLLLAAYLNTRRSGPRWLQSECPVCGLHAHDHDEDCWLGVLVNAADDETHDAMLDAAAGVER